MKIPVKSGLLAALSPSGGPLRGLALGGTELSTEVLWCRLLQPLGINQTQVPHVAARGVQELVEYHVGRLTLEQDGGWVDGHRLVGVQSHVAAVWLQLSCVGEHAVSQAAPYIHQLRVRGFQLQPQLHNKK